MIFKHMNLRIKLLTIGLFLSIVPLIIILAIVLHQNRMVNKTSSEECLTLALSGLDPVARGVYAMCSNQKNATQQLITSSLNAAHRLLDNAGQVNFSEEDTCSWNAVNQYTQEAINISLPKMRVGHMWLDQNKDIAIPSLVVDGVKAMLGVTCTIFQRMDEAGDMLRVCTNVQKADGTRAIGTYIPRINPDGKPNPVITAVLEGKTYHGRAYVVDAWYITAYEPILDASRNVVSVLYVGIPEERVMSEMKEEIKKMKVGMTGYVYVLDSKGNYIISKDGKRDGENIWESRDENGHPFIQEICSKALALGPNDIAQFRYAWKNQDDAVTRQKIVKIMYFQPWDWVIGVGQNEDEILEPQKKIMAIGHRGEMLMIFISALALLGTILVWIFTAQGLTNKLIQVVRQLTHTAGMTSFTSGQVAESSQDMALGASEQAASLEEISSGLEEMSSMTKQNADSARQATIMSNNTRNATKKSMDAMTRMSSAIMKIKSSSDETIKIIKTIDEIAFQTNLLALNAAVEAAHAGDLGRGFAVVAEEVRNLAQRSAEAAKNTAALIAESRESTLNGVAASREVEEILNQIDDSIQKVTQLVTEVSTASDEQAKGTEQINIAMTQIDKVTQQNAAYANQSASASEKLSTQAGDLTRMVDALRDMVGGGNRRVLIGQGDMGIGREIVEYEHTRLLTDAAEDNGSRAHTVLSHRKDKPKDENALTIVG